MQQRTFNTDDGKFKIKGLKAGERVVVAGLQKIHDGAKVRVQDATTSDDKAEQTSEAKPSGANATQ